MDSQKSTGNAGRQTQLPFNPTWMNVFRTFNLTATRATRCFTWRWKCPWWSPTEAWLRASMNMRTQRRATVSSATLPRVVRQSLRQKQLRLVRTKSHLSLSITLNQSLTKAAWRFKWSWLWTWLETFPASSRTRLQKDFQTWECRLLILLCMVRFLQDSSDWFDIFIWIK